MKQEKKRRVSDCLRDRSGTTLVEMVATLLISGMMLSMIAGIMGPAARVFYRMQQLQYAQAVLDQTVTTLQDMAGEASGYVKLYADAAAENSLQGQTGADSGKALEFVNTEGYVELISTQGCPATQMIVGGQHMAENDVKADEISPGRLFARYYVVQDTAAHTYWYEDTAGQAVARAVQNVFASGHDMGNTLEVVFSYPAGIVENDPVFYLEAQISLYADAEKKQLLAQETVALDLRYKAVRYDGRSAMRETETGS